MDHDQEMADPTVRERWEQAAVWRDALAARLGPVVEQLEEAIAGCPISTERVQLRRALTDVVQAKRHAAAGAKTSRARAAEVGER